MATKEAVGLVAVSEVQARQVPDLVEWVRWVRDRLDRSEAPPPASRSEAEDELVQSFGLEPVDVAILWCAVLAEVDPVFPTHLQRFHVDGSRADLDGESIVVLLGGDVEAQLAVRKRLAPGAPLFRHGLLRVRVLPHIDRRMRWPVRPAPTVLRALAGEASGEDPLGGVAEWRPCNATLEDVVLPAALVDEARRLMQAHAGALRHLRASGTTREGRGLVMLFTGAPGTGKTLLAEALTHALGRPLLLVRVDRLLEEGLRAQTRVADLFLEAQLHDAVVFFDECDVLLEGGMGVRAEQLHELERFEGIVILASNRTLALDAALQRRIAWVGHFPAPDMEARLRIWQLHVERLSGIRRGEDVQLPSLAGRFELTGGYIRNAANLAVHRAVARDAEAPLLLQADLQESAQAQLRGDLTGFTKPTDCPLTLGDVILPDDIKGKVSHLLDACRQHDRFLYELGMAAKLPTARGIVALFSGEPGTGKTLCAEVLASELGRPLHRVHLPSVVSRYVGDTEKNITRMFELARARDAILLFDEADSLFATRVRVESSNDRFANMEVNQLLQEIERHDGIVVLTTNLKTSLDNALARRILFRIEFPFPKEGERADIFRHLLPAHFQDAGDPIDTELLAETFDLAGGNIRNVVIRACYRALREGTPLTHDHLEAAGVEECEAIGKIVRVADEDY